METLLLKAQTREVRGKANKKLRREEFIPAVVYGHDFKPVALRVKYLDFEKIFEKAGESSLLDLVIEEKKPLKAIIHEVQTDAKTGRIIHADFHQVKMTEKITTEIVLKFVNEPPAVKELSGVLVKNLDKIKISCLPVDLMREIEVDLSVLRTFEDIIYVKDLRVPDKIEVLDKPDEVVAKVIPPRSEEELKELEEKPEEKVEEVEKVEKEKKEEEEEEKEEPAAGAGPSQTKTEKNE